MLVALYSFVTSSPTFFAICGPPMLVTLDSSLTSSPRFFLHLAPPPPPQTNPGEYAYNSASVSRDTTSQETASPTGSRGTGEESVAVEMDVDVDDERGMSGANGGADTAAGDDVLRAKDEAIAVGWFFICLLSHFGIGGGGRRCGVVCCVGWLSVIGCLLWVVTICCWCQGCLSVVCCVRSGGVPMSPWLSTRGAVPGRVTKQQEPEHPQLL